MYNFLEDILSVYVILYRFIFLSLSLLSPPPSLPPSLSPSLPPSLRLTQFVSILVLPSITVIKDPHFPKDRTCYQYQEQEM